MTVHYGRLFLKDVRKLKNAEVQERVEGAVERLARAQSLAEVASVRKMSGTADCYRMRVGEYRIGLILCDDGVELARVLHRSVIYDRFP
jgi:mRNA interferase RelE/StbE